MFYRRFALLLFILILVFFLVFPGVVLAEGTSTQDTNSNTQQNNNHFRIEVSENNFKNTSENTSGELRIEVQQGQKVEITFVYADDTSIANQHIIFIGGYKIQTKILSKDNPEITVKFTANKTGEFLITCINECAGHKNLQSGKLIVFPGTGLGIESKVTLTLDAPDQTKTGQPMTMAALIKNELGKPVAGFFIKFFVESNFFVNNLMDIGEVVTDEQGSAKIDYTPNQPGVLRVVARYEVGSGLEPVETERTINVIGNSNSFYQTRVGVQFPHSLLFWMVAIVIVLAGVWSTFLYVLYQVNHISRVEGTKGLPLIFMVVVAVLFIILVLVLTTPEAQYNFGLFQ